MRSRSRSEGTRFPQKIRRLPILNRRAPKLNKSAGERQSSRNFILSRFSKNSAKFPPLKKGGQGDFGCIIEEKLLALPIAAQVLEIPALLMVT